MNDNNNKIDSKLDKIISTLKVCNNNDSKLDQKLNNLCRSSRYRNSWWSEKYYNYKSAPPRVVIDVKEFKLKQKYLICGYMRQSTLNNVIIDDICDILNGYLKDQIKSSLFDIDGIDDKAIFL